MATYTYKAKKGPEEWVEGSVEALNRDEAVRRVSELGFIPVQLTEASLKVEVPPPPPPPAATVLKKEKIKTAAVSKSVSPSFMSRIRSREITLFTRQLASLFRSQVPILRALSLISGQSSNAKMKSLIESIHRDIKDGKPLSEALQRSPQYFPRFYISMIRSGEMSGKLEEILDRVAHFREKNEELKSKVQAALAYPMFLLLVGAATVLVLLTFVVPRLLTLFKEMETTLPLPTQILIHVSNFFSSSWPYLLGAAVACAFIYLSQAGLRRRIKSLTDQIKLKLPIIGKLTQSADMERFSRTLALLLKSGLPIVQAVEATLSTLENETIQKGFHSVGTEMTGGVTLSEALAKIPTFPNFVRQMIAVGEEGGRLEEILEEIANSYGMEVERSTKVVTSLIEPMLILVLGLVVGFIVAAMVLPIFQLNMSVQ